MSLPVNIDEHPVAAVNYESIPTQMRNAARWLLWKSVENNDNSKKPKKIPYYFNGSRRRGRLDTPSDLKKLVTFDIALKALKQSNRYNGLGFALGLDEFGNHWQGIDFDDIPNRAILQDLSEEISSYTEVSPSRNGLHIIGYGKLFENLGSNSTGIEAYAYSRFFTVTASNLGNNPLICLADFVNDRLKPLHSPKQNLTLTIPDKSDSEKISPQLISDLRSALLHMRADDRDLWIVIGHALKTLGDTGRGLWLQWSSTSNKFDAENDSRTWDSFDPTRTNYKVVFSRAKSLGWVNPASRIVDISGVGEIKDNSVEFLEENIITISSDENTQELLPHFVENWVPQNEVTLLAGHGGGGKSYVALNIAIHVALGLPFANLDTNQTNVLFFSAEDGALILKYRLNKLCRALKIDPLELSSKLHLLDASDIDPALHREQRVNVGGITQIQTTTPLLDALGSLVEKLNVGLVVIDNASDTFDDDEIKRARVRSFIRSLRSKIAKPDRAVLLLAHVNKASARAAKSADSEDYSGSTAWHNSVRSRLSLKTQKNDLIIEQAKANLGAKSAPVRLEWCEGVPLVTGSYSSEYTETSKAAEQARNDDDKAALVVLIQDFDKRGERVTTSFQGSATVFRLLNGEPGFPSYTDSTRLMFLLRALETEGRIFRRLVRTPDRKQREVFTCRLDGLVASASDHLIVTQVNEK